MDDLDRYLWIRTVGAPAAGDRRDGELHQVLRPLRKGFHLEPWDEADPDAQDAYYVLSAEPPVLDDEGREVWTYEYRPDRTP